MNREVPISQRQLAGRIEAIDLARGLALVAMAIYHFTWDLEFFGYLEPRATAVGGWKLFARAIASSFLILVGISLFLAHRRGIHWPSFLRRLAMVAGAAAAISLATYVATPQAFIFFGILHQIALASLLGLAFLRLPWLLTLLAAAAVIAAPRFLTSEAFDHTAWWWLGLSETKPRSNDYVPLLPWFGAVLVGVAFASLAERSGILSRLAQIHPPHWTWPLRFAGRHSLAVYLLHQPLLIGSVWIFSQIAPPAAESREVLFLQSCGNSCEESADTEFCTRYCACMLDTLEREKLMESIFAGDQSVELRGKVDAVIDQCTAETDRVMLQGGLP